MKVEIAPAKTRFLRSVYTPPKNPDSVKIVKQHYALSLMSHAANTQNGHLSTGINLNNLSSIRIRGARQHNLKNIDLELPRDRLIVFTGVSGSGKSSLAFDTIFAEGQRRYVESLSAYARQFLGQLDKPDVDAIEVLSPAI